MRTDASSCRASSCPYGAQQGGARTARQKDARNRCEGVKGRARTCNQRFVKALTSPHLLATQTLYKPSQAEGL